jgi:hypothetical protein
MVRISYLLVIVAGVALGLFLLERLFPRRRNPDIQRICIEAESFPGSGLQTY